MIYNLTNATNATNLLGFTQELNVLADGYLGIMILVVFWFISFIVFTQYEQDTVKNFTASFTLTTVIALLLITTDLIAWWVVSIPIILTGIFVLILFITHKN